MDLLLVAQRQRVKKFVGVFNLRGILILVGTLAMIDLGVAWGLSPWITRHAQGLTNQYTKAKIYIDGVRFHPFLMSLGVSEFEIFDPDNPEQSIFRAGHVAARVDLWALLKKEIWLSTLSFRRVEIEAVKDRNGRLNFEKIAMPPADAGSWQKVKGFFGAEQRDWYGKLYENFKRVSEMNKKKKETDKTVSANVATLSRGRRVRFDSAADTVFGIRHLELKNGTAALREGGREIPPIRNVYILMKGFRLNRANQVSFRTLKAKGDFELQKRGAFSLDVDSKKDGATADADIRNLDLGAFAPLYEGSLPVSFERGFLSLDSKSRIQGEVLESKNHIKIEDHVIVSKKTLGFFGGVDGPILAALNKRPSFELKFNIGGTPEAPSFGGFHEALMKLVGDDLKNVLASGLAGGGEGGGSAIDKISEKFKSLF